MTHVAHPLMCSDWSRGWSGGLDSAGHHRMTAPTHSSMSLARTAGEPVPPWELTGLWEHGSEVLSTGHGSGQPEAELLFSTR